MYGWRGTIEELEFFLVRTYVSRHGKRDLKLENENRFWHSMLLRAFAGLFLKKYVSGLIFDRVIASSTIRNKLSAVCTIW